MSISKQIEMENLYSKNQLMTRLKNEFRNSKEPDFTGYLEHLDIDYNFGITLLAQMSLHKRCDLPTLVGIMASYADTLQEVADLLLRCAEANLIDWKGGLQQFVTKYNVSADVQEELDRFQYPLPFVVVPNTLENNNDLGYYTTTGSVILKKNHHEGDVCLDHLNHCNSVPFSIDHRVVSMVKNQWRNLDKPKTGESKDDFAKRVRAFEKYDRTAHDVMALLPEQFHLSHRPDKRGRTYCQGYHVSYQGSAWNKAVIEFAEKEVCE
jgi:hypothetical protein